MSEEDQREFLRSMTDQEGNQLLPDEYIDMLLAGPTSAEALKEMGLL